MRTRTARDSTAVPLGRSDELPTLEVGTGFLGDLHLDVEDARAVERFEALLGRLGEAPRVVLVGDVFEYWFGPAQARSPGGERAISALRRLIDGGTAVDLVPGNRDFLLGADFERRSGVRLWPEGLLVRLPGGAPLLVLHGDELCTKDLGYQRLRRVLRSPLVLALSAWLPAWLGRAIARRLRRASQRALAQKPKANAEQQPEEAGRRARAAGADVLLVGHAHSFRDRRLHGGVRWLVLDAWGGERDLLWVGPDGELVAAGSEAPTPGTLSASMIVAIDGPAASGKSTAARRLAERLGLRFLDTGAMYRAIAWLALEREIAPSDGSSLERLAESVRMDFGPDGLLRVDGRPAEPQIRGARVTALVSEVSAHGGVRLHVVRRQRELAREWGGLVAEGRDTTTVVFPQADHKFYLWASPRERARRRARELGNPEREDQICAELEQRDHFDSTRAIAPLRQAPDALRIDSDGMSPEEVVAALARAVGVERTASEGSRP